MLEINNLTKENINEPRLRDIFDSFIKKFKISKQEETSLAIINDGRMVEINKQYRGQEQTTDILAFSDLNEIIINIQQIIRQADEQGKNFFDELDFIFVHGLLHLIGYEDDTEEGRLEMINLGKEFLLSL